MLISNGSCSTTVAHETDTDETLTDIKKKKQTAFECYMK